MNKIKILLIYIYIYIYIYIFTPSSLYAEEAQAGSVVKWSKNPFRKSDSEMLLFGWQDPNAYLTRFWIGDIVTKNDIFIDPDWRLDKVLTYFSPTIATEISPIAFSVDRYKVRIGVAFFIELNLLAYDGYKLTYGSVPLYSDYINVGAYIDLIVDDVWKFRWMPLVHICSHAGGDFLGDPLFDDTREGTADMGNESMSFALYRHYKGFTFYGGLGFRMITNQKDMYGTLFNAFAGMDYRVPVWNYINLIVGIYYGASYDEIKDSVTQAAARDWYHTVSTGFGIEIDRMIFGLRYINMRSRHVFSYQVREERIGFETTLFF